jgi:hypothetical protein
MGEFFLDFFALAAWEIWNIRNKVIFDNVVAIVNLWARNFKSQGYLHLVRVKKDKQTSFIRFFREFLKCFFGRL